MRTFIIMLISVVTFLAGVSIFTNRYLDWRDSQQLMTLVPVSEEVVYDPYAHLSDLEFMLVDKWGWEHYRVARAIAVCESGMNPEAVNWATRDLGLMQINWPTWNEKVKEHFGYTIADYFDPEKNVEIAYWIWDRDGDGEGSWSPWVALGNDCFLNEL